MRMLFLLIVLSIPGLATAEEAPLAVPIVIAGEIGKDACPTRGRVAGVGDRPDAALPVRNGPGENEPFKVIDRLQDGMTVLICERLGGWSGVVYGSDPLGCRTYAVLPVSQEYTGPCQRGWVQSRFIDTTTE